MMPVERPFGARLPGHYDSIIPHREDVMSEAGDILHDAEGQDAVDEAQGASWSRFLEHMGDGAGAGRSCVGLFWCVGQQLVTSLTPLLQARVQGAFLLHAADPLETWRQWQRFGPKVLARYGLPPEIAGTGHTSHPGGRVVFCWQAPAFLVYADRLVLKSDGMIAQVLNAFGLDAADCLLRPAGDRQAGP